MKLKFLIYLSSLVFISVLGLSAEEIVVADNLKLLRSCYDKLEVPDDTNTYNIVKINGVVKFNNITNNTDFTLIYSKGTIIYIDKNVEIYQIGELKTTVLHQQKEIHTDTVSNINNAMNLIKQFKQDSLLTNLILTDSNDNTNSKHLAKVRTLNARFKNSSNSNTKNVSVDYVIDLQNTMFQQIHLLNKSNNMDVLYNLSESLLGVDIDQVSKQHPEVLYIKAMSKLYEKYDAYTKN